MGPKTFLYATGALVFLAIMAAAYVMMRPVEPRTYALQFEAMSGDTPFIFDEFVHADPVGGESFQLRDFRFYVSNIQLSDGEEVYAVPESYHLVRFDARRGKHEVVLPEVPLEKVTNISLSIGLDPEANKTIMPLGDVDPNSRMAWNWAIGYKFLLVEGELQSSTGLVPLVYHVGFDESLRQVNLGVESPSSEIAVDVDVMKLFNSRSTFDLSVLSSIKMDRGDAAMMADNYATMLAAAEK